MPKLKSESVAAPRTDSTSVAIGINILDLLRIPEEVRGAMGLADLLDRDRGNTVQVDKDRLDEVCTPFTCDRLRAACLCDVIRRSDSVEGRPATRVYLRRAEKWTRIPREAELTSVVGERIILNPELFPPERVVAAPSAAPKRRRME